MSHLLIFGLGYSAQRIANRLAARGWRISGVRRTAADGVIAFDDEAAVRAAIGTATHILSSVPPDEGGDPVLRRYGAQIGIAPARWLGYLSSTGVYGDTGGAWVDEYTPVGGGRRSHRTEADLAWQALRDDVRIFRLPGIYGPGRSALDRVLSGQAKRIDLSAQVFSRIHVDDLATGVIASMERGPAGIYNLADNHPCSQNRVIEYACRLMGKPLPPMQDLGAAALSPAAAAFYSENRRIANGRAMRLLGWRPAYPDYRAGLNALFAARPGVTSG